MLVAGKERDGHEETVTGGEEERRKEGTVLSGRKEERNLKYTDS